jgi:hypothetical protein
MSDQVENLKKQYEDNSVSIRDLEVKLVLLQIRNGQIKKILVSMGEMEDSDDSDSTDSYNSYLDSDDDTDSIKTIENVELVD